MPLATTAIILIAALAHALWNLASKYKRGDTVVFVWAYTCASALLCLPIGITLAAVGAQPISWQLAAGSLVSAVLHLTYSLTLQAGYDRADLGVVYPVARGTGPVLTMLAAMLVFGERLASGALLGALMVVAGILVVTSGSFRSRGPHRPPGVGWGVTTGAAIAGYTLWDGYAVTSLQLAPASYYAGTLLLQSLLLAPIALRRPGPISAVVGANTAPIIGVAVLSPLAYILVLIAMQTAPVALVAPLRESSVILGSLLAWWLFRERHLARRLTGAAIVLTGIVAISG